MSEKQTAPRDPSPAEELAGILDRTGEAPAAAVEQFRDLKASFEAVIAAHDAGNVDGDYQAVAISKFLRRAGEPDDAPRFRVTSDPRGELYSGTNYGDTPAIVLRVEQGQKGEAYAGKGKRGSWAAELYLMEAGDGVRAIMQGTKKTGRGKSSLEPLPGASPHGYRASEELLEWARRFVEDPEGLAPAPTRVEKSTARWIGRITGSES